MVSVGCSVEEVGQWLCSGISGLQDVQSTVELFSDAGLDGHLLSTISSEELEALVGLTDSAQIQIILAARDAAFADALSGQVVSGGDTDKISTNDRKYPPLYQVVKQKDASMVLQMLQDGVDPNDAAQSSPSTSPAALRRTPLHLSGLYRLPGIMAALLEHGASVNYTDSNNWSALHYAALSGDEHLARLLLEAGADRSIVTAQGGALGETPAQFARRHRQLAFADVVDKWAAP